MSSLDDSEILNDDETFLPLVVRGSILYAFALEADTINAYDINLGGVRVRTFKAKKSYSKPRVRGAPVWKGLVVNNDGIFVLVGRFPGGRLNGFPMESDILHFTL